MLIHLLAFIVSLPARIKGIKMGKKSILAPGYPFWSANYNNVIIGNHVVIERNSFIQTFESGSITIGNNTHIGKDCTISSNTGISIGNTCLLGYRVSLLDHDHTNDGLQHGKHISIGHNCVIGTQAVILKGVELGDGCIVGANSVVTRSFPQGSVIAGNPAKKIK